MAFRDGDGDSKLPAVRALMLLSSALLPGASPLAKGPPFQTCGGRPSS